MTSLRERLSDPRILVAVGAHDGLTATLAQRAGLEAIYQGGYAVAAHHHGLPDIGLVGLSDVAQSLRRMTAVASVPVIVDADTGYGSEPGVRRAVLELESAGAAAIQIEDQVFPKRCGHMAGKTVISRE
ncbi:MAG: isocitrate lyase/PEP mutase family protein, partial [Trebonia sp.]